MATWALKKIPRPLSKVSWGPRARIPNRFPVKHLGGLRQPVYGPAGDLDARMTTAGRILRARGLAEGVGIQITHFAVGTGGYYPGIPTQAIPVDPNAGGLINEVLRKAFVTFGLTVAFPAPEAISFYCRLEKLEAPFALGELMLVATIINSPLHPGEVGTLVPFVIVHYPMVAHSLGMVLSWRTTVLP